MTWTYSFLFFTCIFFHINIASAQSKEQAVDYSSFEIAKKYQKEKNYVFAYKHLLIFKYSNLERLNKPENKENLTMLDKKLDEFEQLLQQNMSWYEIKNKESSRGFSDKQIDSLINVQYSKIAIDSINIR